MDKTYKYYIEFSDEESSDVYFAQTEFFDTEEEALEWAQKIVYIRFSNYRIWLMRAMVDEYGDIEGDIEQVQRID